MIAWAMLKTIVPRELVVSANEVDLCLKLTNESRVELRGADNPDSLRGVGLEFAVLDEYADMKPNVWQEIIRPMLTDTKGKALFIGTPKGKNAFWELFLKGQKGEDGFAAWQFTTIDNPFIDPKEVEQARKELSDRYFKQEFEACFEDYVGLVWPEYQPEIHLTDPIYIPDHWEQIGAIDPAITGTTACLKAAVDTDGELWFFSEYYEQDVRVSEAAKKLKQDKDIHWVIDPASNIRNQTVDGRLYTLHTEYQDYGIYANPAENDVMGGINRVAEMFKTDKIHIFKGLKNLQWELERYHWCERDDTSLGEQSPSPYKKADHLCLEGNTLVLMADNTEKAIKDIRINDRVKTPSGDQRVIDSQKTGEDKSIWKITFSNGRELLGTKDHRIYTPQGKVAISELKIGQECLGLSTRAKDTIGMANIMQMAAENLVFMLRSGKQIMAKSLMDIAYIIGTAIDGTTSLITSNLCTHLNINPCTAVFGLPMRITEPETSAIWEKSGNLQRFGMPRKQEKNGIRSIARKYGKAEKRSSSNAFIAVESLKRTSKRPNTATTTARPLIVESVLETGRTADVYNITVEREHCYYANGVLSANCDCLRYIAMAHKTASAWPKYDNAHYNSPWEKVLKKNPLNYKREYA